MPQATAMNPIVNIVPLLIIIVIFYLFIIKPQKKDEKDRQQMLKNLSKNDEVVTTGGIHGTIVNVKDKTVIVRVDDNVKLEIEKNCVVVKKQQTN
jgi:preprotein translocase subunit YajC